MCVSSGTRTPYSLARSAVANRRAEATSGTPICAPACSAAASNSASTPPAIARSSSRLVFSASLPDGSGRGGGASGAGAATRLGGRGPCTGPDITHNATPSAMASPSPTAQAAPIARQSSGTSRASRR